ncbi:secondary alcohol dehydrogenase (SADH2) [Scheffersomyces stipitis CBS 6054]|uniref:Secondary alcohol dehydrogenase (SADH2) n=1 Tax=Scheffersomyces stipitis (strain ATCC 58785 / CBS 6054 / NBRC 10063 / NRRL Y-11545) TaxID=322104 RepID=A3LV78_PICST|nr:secondary alcohol dehydrogenase (SADH2) [Scheffersomyces stipitis CBS 6054]ABN66727.2 secondary alcohol dehydrogenase (SADH2) [Scheffersomyces stipitis CBS 6054]KAG2734546.1 hypothetical protein G9P44_002552 [Scheffersomyces stipitis]
MSIPATQYGFVFTKKDGLKIRENMPVLEPKADQVLLKVDAVGLCHSDLHAIYDGFDFGDNYVMGHEIAGTIVKKGAMVDFWDLNTRVACFGPNSCGHCQLCRTGFENDCINVVNGWFGLGKNGGYQQYLLVEKPRNLVAIPDNVESSDAAAITDALLTPYHAMRLAGVRSGTKLLQIGAGGLGVNGIQIAKAFGAQVTVIDKKPEAVDVAKSLGADEVYSALPESTSPGSFDVAIDYVSTQGTFDTCQKYVRSKGNIVPVGLAAPRISFNLGDLALREINVLGSFWGTSSDLKECFDLVSKGKVKPKVTVAPLKQLPEYIVKLQNSAYEGRVVFKP